MGQIQSTQKMAVYTVPKKKKVTEKNIIEIMDKNFPLFDRL